MTIFLIVSAGAVVSEGRAAIQPNILFILADDLGYECLGAYGGTSYKTPHLDQLAAGGLRFTHCFSTPKCSPTRVTLLTGRYTFRTTREWGYLPPEEITLGQVLQEAGYRTALAGKWQLGMMKEEPDRVSRAGFQENCVWAWHEGPRYWQPMIYQNGQVRTDVGHRYGPEVFSEFLVDFIEAHQDRPFLAYYPMVLAHFPKADEPKGPQGRWETYAEMVARMDQQVGRLVAVLDRLNLRERTLIVFAGDNGSPQSVTSRLGDRAIRGGKATLKDAGTRVPLIANWPGTVPAGAVNNDLIDFSDFLPTLAELAGARLPENRTIDGRSFAPRLRGQPGRPRSWVFTEWEGAQWVRDHRWKLYDNGRLFDMVHDPLEEEAVTETSGEAAGARRHLQAVFDSLRSFFEPPPEHLGQLGSYRSPLVFADGRPVERADQWPARRREILAEWHGIMGAWPPLLADPELKVLETSRRENFRQYRVSVPIAPGQETSGYLLVPDGTGPFPAVLVPFYEPETSIGLGGAFRDFGYQLARRGFVTLSIGSPGGDAREPALGEAVCQPLSYLAYVAANCRRALARRPEVDAARIGVVGHSYGGKWAMFAACLDDQFACTAWSDPGIVFDETRPNVNYWDRWYLGAEATGRRSPGVPGPDHPRTGAYKVLVETGHDLHELHALMAPRPFLVSGGSEDPPSRWQALNHTVAVNRLLGQKDRVAMTHREGHAPTAESNEQIYLFFEHFLKSSQDFGRPPVGEEPPGKALPQRDRRIPSS